MGSLLSKPFLSGLGTVTISGISFQSDGAVRLSESSRANSASWIPSSDIEDLVVLHYCTRDALY